MRFSGGTNHDKASVGGDNRAARRARSGSLVDGAMWASPSHDAVTREMVGTDWQQQNWIREQREIASADELSMARGLTKALEGQASDAARQMTEHIISRYENLSPETVVLFRRDVPRGAQVRNESPSITERAGSVQHGLMSKRWGSKQPLRRAWRLDTLDVLQFCALAYLRVRCSGESSRAPVVALSPLVSDSANSKTETGKAEFEKMWVGYCNHGIGNAQKVLIPCLRKTTDHRSVGHFYLVVLQRQDAIITLRDPFLVASAVQARTTVEKSCWEVVSRMGELWGVEEKQWRFCGKAAGVVQSDGETCGPRCLLTILCEMCGDADGAINERWKHDIEAVESFFIQEMHRRACPGSDADEDESVYFKGQLVQRASRLAAGLHQTGDENDPIQLECYGSVGQASVDEGAIPESAGTRPASAGRSESHRRWSGGSPE